MRPDSGAAVPGSPRPGLQADRDGVLLPGSLHFSDSALPDAAGPGSSFYRESNGTCLKAKMQEMGTRADFSISQNSVALWLRKETPAFRLATGDAPLAVNQQVTRECRMTV